LQSAWRSSVPLGSDHADDKKAVLAAALETAFDPATSTNCIGLDQAPRDCAAAWLPPGMAYGDAADDVSAGRPDQHNGSARAGDDDEPADYESASTDLPAFLTDDEPVAAALNGASAP
jgi:hypothetical protein